MIGKIINVGNSLGITLNKNTINGLGLNKGDFIDINIKKLNSSHNEREEEHKQLEDIKLSKNDRIIKEYAEKYPLIAQDLISGLITYKRVLELALIEKKK